MMHLIPAFVLVCAGIVQCTAGQGTVDETFFYGQSPPVYPSPPGSGTGNWAAAYSKAKALVGQMTLIEKVNLTFGVSSQSLGCVGDIPAISRLGFPGLCLQDAGNGVRLTDFVNSWPSGLHVGASWNKDLAHRRAVGMGGEFRAKGVNIALGPVVGPLGRVATAGRNWEGFTNDPYLCGALAYETVSGIQSQGVATSTKHFIGNEQETNRNPVTNNTAHTFTQSVSSNIDDTTMHELYLWPFQDAVHAGSGTIMCSYNRVNNSYSCQNSAMLNGLLKTELGFQGLVVSDWGAQHAGYASALAGLDMAMPTGSTFFGPNLTAAVNNGSLPIERLDDMATRIIATWYQLGQDKGYPPNGVGIIKTLPAPHVAVNARSPASRQTLLDGAIEGHVLVKNKNNALPLKNPELLSLFGYSAHAPLQNDVGPLWQNGGESYSAYVGNIPNSQIAINGTIVSGGGSGANSPAYIDSPFNGIVQRIYETNTTIMWDFVNINATGAVDGATDACLVFINAWAMEGVDRPGLHDTFSDNLVNNIANQCGNTIVIIHNAGIRLVDTFVNHPNVTGIIYAHLPGQDSGRALAQILFGDISPSGKLPYTVAKNESDYGALLNPSQPEGQYIFFPQSDFTEGLDIDYRAFNAKGITPRYEFGFGLSYTTFEYSSLTVTLLPNVSTQTYPSGPILEGGQSDLWDVVARVTAQVKNTGSVDGAEISQLYVNRPSRGGLKELRGFSKQDITPGQTVEVTFDLTRRDLSIWDTGAQKWKLQSGSYGVWVGASSKILPLQGSLKI